MAWTVLRTVTDYTDYVTAADHNQTRANFDIIGGTDGATKTGNWYVSGNVGIGTTSPATPLHVSSANTQTEITIESTVAASRSTLKLLTNGNDWELGARGSSLAPNNAFYIYDLTNTSYRMTIDSSGNVGIGTTSPASLLGVNGVVQITSASPGWPTSGIGLELLYNSGADAAQIQSYARTGSAYKPLLVDALRHEFRASGTGKVFIDSAGNLGIGTGSPGYQLTLSTDSAAKPTSNTWTISSDARVKDVIGPYTRGVADLMALEPKRYRLNGAFGSVDDGRVHVSVIAQETQTTWPEMIGTYEHADKDEDGVETVTELFNLNTNELQWALVNAVKELAQRVEALEA
jgi:hypothetical protein